MWYLFAQIWLWVTLSFILGWFAHWYFSCRSKTETTKVTFNGTQSLNADTNAADSETRDKPTINDAWKPRGLASTPDVSDNLKRIKGIGSANEKALNQLGIYQFTQIAEWSAENIQWVEDFLAFPGRVDREDWVGQAKALSSEGQQQSFSMQSNN